MRMPKIYKISHSIGTHMISFMLHSCVNVKGKSVNDLFLANEKYSVGLFYYLFLFLYTLLHVFTRLRNILYLLRCQEKKNKLENKKCLLF